MSSPYPFDFNDDMTLYDDEFQVVSNSECTGLIPSEPFNDYELKSYESIYDIPLS